MSGKKASNIDVTRMNYGQLSEFMTANIGRGKADETVSRVLAAELKAWDEANTQLDAYFKQEQKSVLTEDITNADDERDRDLVALRGAARAMKRIPGKDLQLSARRVNLCMDNYKIEEDWEMQRESNMIKQMLDDLTSKYADDVAKLGLGAFVEKLRESNELCRQLLLEREESKAGYVSGQAKAWRRRTEQTYRAFVEMLNARCLVEGSDAYADFIDKLNASIEHYRQILATAAGVRAAQKAKADGGSGKTSGGSATKDNEPVPTDTDGGDDTGDDDGDGTGGSGDGGSEGGGDTGGGSEGGGDTGGGSGSGDDGGDTGGGGGGNVLG